MYQAPPKMSEAGETAAELANISVSSRVPNMWVDMPRMWFAQVESVLAPQKLGDQAKYDFVVARLDREALQQVSDIITSPPSTDKYKTLKERLLHVFEESAERQFQKLVSEMELGTQKPTQLLRRMRDLGRNAKTSEDTLRNLWISRLPTSARAVLTVSHDQTLDYLANIADKVMENIRSGDIAEISTLANAGSSSSQVPVNEILTEMQKLNLEVASLREEVNQQRRSATRRGRGQGGYRPRSRSRTPNDPDWLCKWHFRYRRNARNCEKPCAWKTPSEN